MSREFVKAQNTRAFADAAEMRVHKMLLVYVCDIIIVYISADIFSATTERQYRYQGEMEWHTAYGLKKKHQKK